MKFHADILIMLVAVSSVTVAAESEPCPPIQGVALQILGSGGPIADDGRASAGYLVWVDGQSTLLIDVGGGTFLRFGEAGANFDELDFIGLSHFHTDHSADFPALLKSGYFSNRERSLIVAGPDAGGPFLGLIGFLERLLDDDSGVYGYLSGYLDGSGGLVKLNPFEVSRKNAKPVTVFGDVNAQVQIDALHVPHGIVPALAYKIRLGQATIVFGSDQNGDDSRFVNFAKNATLLIMHMPVPEGIAGAGRRLHAPPSVIGKIAARADVEALVVSHLMARSLKDLAENLEIVSLNYPGTVILANDLDCILLTE